MKLHSTALDRKETKTLIFQDKRMQRGFAAVPRIILRDSSIPAAERLLYALLLDYAWQDGECFPGQDRLASDMGVSERQIRTLLKSLKKRKLISIKRQGLNKPNIYIIKDLLRRKSPAECIDKGVDG